MRNSLLIGYIISMIIIMVLIIAAFITSSASLSIAAVALLIFVTIFYLLVPTAERFEKFSDPKVEELKEKLTSVFPEARRLKFSGSNESFTIDKQHIYLCIRDKNGNYYDDNSLMYVLLHEFAHVLDDEVTSEEEHQAKFRYIFKKLLDKAAAAGIYDPTIPMVKNYCGYKD